MRCSVGEVLEGIHITMPYSIASYMVRDFLRESSTTGIVDEELVGTLTGILVSSTYARGGAHAARVTCLICWVKGKRFWQQD